MAYDLQIYYDTNDDGNAAIWGAFLKGQTFTTVDAFAVSRVSMLLYRIGSPGTVTLSIKATNSGLPTGADLVSAAVNGNDFPISPPVWVDFDFSTPLLLSATTQYAIVVRAPSGSSGNEVRGRYDNTSSAYADGQAVASSNSGGTWANQSADHDDYMFRTYSTAASYADMAATGGGTGGGSATMEVVGFLDMEATGGGTGGGSATMTLVQWCRFLVDRDGASQAAVAGKVSDVTALVGGQVTAQTQITYTANGTVTNPTSITTENGRITAITANPYGSMYASNVTHAVVITTVDTYVEIASDMTGGLESGMTFQNNHEIKATVTGKYLVNWSLSVSSDSANREIEGSVMVNGSEVAAVSSHAETSLGAAGRPMTICGSGIIALATNDVVSLGVENHTDAVDLVMQHATCTLLKVGS